MAYVVRVGTYVHSNSYLRTHVLIYYYKLYFISQKAKQCVAAKNVENLAETREECNACKPLDENYQQSNRKARIFR